MRWVQQQGELDEVPADQEGDSQSLAGNKSPGQLEPKIGSGQTSDTASQSLSLQASATCSLDSLGRLLVWGSWTQNIDKRQAKVDL